ncbi:MAG: hypothetical protein ACRD0K_10635 [Egibacteraceae bacterium]
MVAETDVSERQIRLALAYGEHYPWQIDEAITENGDHSTSCNSSIPSSPRQRDVG